MKAFDQIVLVTVAAILVFALGIVIGSTVIARHVTEPAVAAIGATAPSTGTMEPMPAHAPGSVFYDRHGDKCVEYEEWVVCVPAGALQPKEEIQ